MILFYHKTKWQNFTGKSQLAFFVCSFACMTSPLLRYSLIIYKLPWKRIKAPKTTIGGFFSINLTKYKENQWWNVLHIRAYGVTYAEFKTLKLSIILKPDQNIAWFCTRFFPDKTNKNIKTGVKFWPLKGFGLLKGLYSLYFSCFP